MIRLTGAFQHEGDSVRLLDMFSVVTTYSTECFHLQQKY